MGSKTTDWRPGPTVCRCCLSEGCYKDISTEYFWMGKREVYAEMLSETFSLSIAYSQSGGPNSNSRLICEPCISRLRDASDFRKQVQECEKTFMQYLDPGTSVAELEGDFLAPVTVEPVDTQVKVERVKLEKAVSDDDFDDRTDFREDDDDDDDLDDQPLTKLASKVPKKESVDILDLLDNAKVGEKRKSSSKAKTPVTKKSKTKKEAKATSSKAPKPEKKKKGRKSRNVVDEGTAQTGTDIKPVLYDSIQDNLDEREALSEVRTEQVEDIKPAELLASAREMGDEKRALFRRNVSLIMESCSAYPFKYRKGTYLCYHCKSTFLEPEKLREHNKTQHADAQITAKPRKYEPLKMDFTETVCTLCDIEIQDYNFLKQHLKTSHSVVIDCTYGECVLPYKLTKDEYSCQICGKRYEMFLSLHKHMNVHFGHYICERCGKIFATKQRMVNHARTHARGVFPCRQCKETFLSYASMHAHVAKVHRSNKRYKCPVCDEKFASYKHRVKHLSLVHGKKTAVFPCSLCPKVFDLCSRRTTHIKFQHLQERNHVCHECGMKFFSNYELQEHSIKHNGERIYQCDVCKKSYARLKTLREHMRIHNDDRRFVCFVCGQSFIQNCSLKQHMRVHHHMKNDLSSLAIT